MSFDILNNDMIQNAWKQFLKVQGMRVFIGGQIDLNLVDLDSGLQLIAVWTQSDFKWIGGELTKPVYM